MPVEQGLPWHPVATGLAGQAIPFIVAASNAHAPPSAPFRFPVPAVLVASPTLLCHSSLSAMLALVPLGVAPALCVFVLLLPLSGGAPRCPCRAPPPVPPACPPPVRGKRELNTGQEVFGQWPVDCSFQCLFLFIFVYFVKKWGEKIVLTCIYFLVCMGLHPCFWLPSIEWSHLL